MPRDPKYYFYLSGITRYPQSYLSHKIETFDFDSNIRSKLNEECPRWIVHVDFDSLTDSSFKTHNVFPHIISGWAEDDSAYAKRYEFFMTQDKEIAVHMTTGLHLEGIDKLPIPKYMCDFLRKLVEKLEQWESEGSKGYFMGEYIPKGYVFET
ncbi:hypothetical protein GCM10023310_69790 [Paenibacillus vulneris]|uniref:Uncharacterized protein n=1 Tax=Paenibacillus vulneris TaxID=1133364 RepID=A0ABW3UGD8_9BACL